MNEQQGTSWVPQDALHAPWPNVPQSLAVNGNMQGYQQQQQFVYPHINPLFANAFAYSGGFSVGTGFGTGMQNGQFPAPEYQWAQQQPYAPYSKDEYNPRGENFR
jgi:hypothetical protein